MKLLASKIKVGHCVVINECDRPYSKLVAVVTDLDDGYARCKYLLKDPSLNQFNSRGGMECSLSDLMPVEAFGVEVHYSEILGRYICLPVGSSSAKYKDGKTRLWQDTNIFYNVPRKKVLAVALGAIK